MISIIVYLGLDGACSSGWPAYEKHCMYRKGNQQGSRSRGGVEFLENTSKGTVRTVRIYRLTFSCLPPLIISSSPSLADS